MPEPYSFPGTTPFAKLPLLFAGQTQKEFFVNQALSIIDALMQHRVVASTNAPPSEPDEGAAYRVTTPASGDWTGKEDAIALRIGGGWQFIPAFAGIRIFDQEAGQLLVFTNAWDEVETPALPNGGSIVDAEARAAITQIIDALNRLGLTG